MEPALVCAIQVADVVAGRRPPELQAPPAACDRAAAAPRNLHPGTSSRFNTGDAERWRRASKPASNSHSPFARESPLARQLRATAACDRLLVHRRMVTKQTADRIASAGPAAGRAVLGPSPAGLRSGGKKHNGDCARTLAKPGPAQKRPRRHAGKRRRR